MEPHIPYSPFLTFVKSNKASVWMSISALLVVLSVFQDFLFSTFRSTGFYLSESLAYNLIWIFLVPLWLLEFNILARFETKSRFKTSLTILGVSVALTALHILLFTSLFIAISHIAFSPAHRFVRIFKSALSNQLFILLLCYTIAPVLYNRFLKTKKTKETSDSYAERIHLKVGLKTLSFETAAIQMISTDKPYSVVTIQNKKYMDNRTLKEFESLLNPKQFARVHRSYIIPVNTVQELTSRQNGDYDALLEHGETIRLSRHFRTNWKYLLQ